MANGERRKSNLWIRPHLTPKSFQSSITSITSNRLLSPFLLTSFNSLWTILWDISLSQLPGIFFIFRCRDNETAKWRMLFLPISFQTLSFRRNLDQLGFSKHTLSKLSTWTRYQIPFHFLAPFYFPRPNLIKTSCYFLSSSSAYQAFGRNELSGGWWTADRAMSWRPLFLIVCPNE